jgi:Ras GTPase-activating-like protein IQGAP2/3
LSISIRSTPETFDIVSSTVDVGSRKNLAQISKVLAQVTSGSEFGDDTPSYIPINEYVKKAISQITYWLFEGGGSIIVSCHALKPL